MRPVGVGGNDKSVFALQKSLGKLVADAVSFLRRNFSRLEGLPHLIGDDIAFLAAPSGPLVVEVHGGGRIVEHRQQILLHVSHRGGVFCQRIQHEADVVGIQLFQPTAYYLGWLVISGNPQHLAFGRTGVHKQIHDLVDGVLLVRAEPEKQLGLQRLIKIILKLLPDAPGIDRVRIVPLCFILISLICLRFYSVRASVESCRKRQSWNSAFGMRK